MSEQMWIERAQSCEAQLNTYKDTMDRQKEDARTILDTFGARKTENGFSIDYEKFVENLGEEGAKELKKVIDEKY